MLRARGLTRAQILSIRKIAGDTATSDIYLDVGECNGTAFIRPHTTTLEGITRVVVGMDWLNVYCTGWNDSRSA